MLEAQLYLSLYPFHILLVVFELCASLLLPASTSTVPMLPPSECLSLACSFTCIFTSALTFVPNFFPYTAPHYTLYLLLSTPVFTGSLTLNSFSVKCLPNVASLYTTGFRLSEASPYFPLRWSSHYETESRNAES